jgi:hypothetical protein
MLFKVSGLRPLVRLPQCYLYSDKSRRVLYSADDYHRTKAFAHRTFQESARTVPTAYGGPSSAVLSSARIDGPRVMSSTEVPPQSSSSSSSNSSATKHNSTSNDDAVASIADAAGVATKALFSFASTLSKSVLDIAQTSMAHVTAQVGDKQVLILKQVAEGGFGTVYLAEDSSSSRLYAVKHLLCHSCVKPTSR